MLDWLQNHGEVFLRKNVGIGRNLQKARAYQKSHETFEGVVQVRHDSIAFLSFSSSAVPGSTPRAKRIYPGPNFIKLFTSVIYEFS